MKIILNYESKFLISLTILRKTTLIWNGKAEGVDFAPYSMVLQRDLD